MSLTVESIPEWAPEILRRLYVSRQEEQQDHSTDALLQKLVFDPRMKSVWKAIAKREPPPNYSFCLFVWLSVCLHPETPKESPDALKRRYTHIADLAKQLIEAMKDSVLEREGMRPVVAGIAHSADELRHGVDVALWPYIQTIDRFEVKDPVRTMLARQLYRKFKADFGTPLWQSIAALVEVICEVETDVNWVRACVLG